MEITHVDISLDQGIISESNLFFDPMMGRTLGRSFVIFAICSDYNTIFYL